jgi:thiamine biosynthesis protein ThiI
VQYDLIIIRYGEIALKGKYTRGQFENKLVKNIKEALNTHNIKNNILRESGRIYLNCKIDRSIIRILKKIFGIKSFSPALKTKSDIDFIIKIALNIIKNKLYKENSFAIRVTRTGEHDFTSQDIAKYVGKIVKQATNAKVNLSNPDFELFIEIRKKYAYLFTKKIDGPAGMPLGTQGKFLSIIEDKKSILASWFLLRRGCDAIFAILERSYNDEINQFKSDWFLSTKSYDLTKRDNDIYKYLNEISITENCSCVVSGNILSKNIDEEITKIKSLKNNLLLPIITPLIAMDKKEVKKKCNDIGIKI